MNKDFTMRRFDKIKNMRNVNILLEQRYLTSKGVFNEGVIKLTDDEVNQLKRIVPFIKKAIKEKYYNKGINQPIKYKTSDGKDAEAWIYVYNKNDNSAAHYQSQDLNNLKDNWIGVNANFYGTAYEGFLEKTFNKLTGQSPDESLLSSLKHELIHAKDPAVNHHYSKVPYDPNEMSIYYGGWVEFPAQTGQFFEAISQRTMEQLSQDSSEQSIEKLFKVYDDILDFYSGKNKTFNEETGKWLSGGNKGNLFQKFVSKIVKMGEKFVGNISPNYVEGNLLYNFSYSISMIKKYNPEGYKEFQKDLYKLIDEHKDYIRQKYIKNKPKALQHLKY